MNHPMASDPRGFHRPRRLPGYSKRAPRGLGDPKSVHARSEEIRRAGWWWKSGKGFTSNMSGWRQMPAFRRTRIAVLHQNKTTRLAYNLETLLSRNYEKNICHRYAAVCLVTWLLAVSPGQGRPLNIKERSLPNGLKVVRCRTLLARPSHPRLVDVGSKNDPPNRKALRIFEHLMFKLPKYEVRNDGPAYGRCRRL